MALILIVEDEADLRDLIAEMIRELGHEAQVCDSAEAAMPILEKFPIEVLVTDVGLPGVSGDVLAAEGRGLRPGLGVIFLTGGSVIRETTPDGFNPILLRKPFDLDALEIALGRVR